MRERNGETRSVTGISKELSQSPKNKTTNTEENETTNEIETMNKLLDEMKKESEKRTEIRKFIFDKNFEKKIKTCINMRAEIDAYAAECETIIQSETLITKPVKETMIENTYENFGMNCSQTATASEIFTILPMEQQLPTIKHFVGACKATHVILPKKNENEQISIEHVDSAGKKMVKGFGEVALTKVGHWSKSAFNFFRIKNISSGKDATVSRKSQKKTSNAGTDNSGQYVKDEEIERPRENLKRKRWVCKMKSRSHHKIKCQKSKKILRKSVKHRGPKKTKLVLKMPRLIRFSNRSKGLKKQAAKLTSEKEVTKKKRRKVNRGKK